MADELMERWRQLLVHADSMLSAYGYGRVVTKEEAIDLSARIRAAYKAPLPTITCINCGHRMEAFFRDAAPIRKTKAKKTPTKRGTRSRSS